MSAKKAKSIPIPNKFHVRVDANASEYCVDVIPLGESDDVKEFGNRVKRYWSSDPFLPDHLSMVAYSFSMNVLFWLTDKEEALLLEWLSRCLTRDTRCYLSFKWRNTPLAGKRVRLFQNLIELFLTKNIWNVKIHIQNHAKIPLSLYEHLGTRHLSTWSLSIECDSASKVSLPQNNALISTKWETLQLTWEAVPSSVLVPFLGITAIVFQNRDAILIPLIIQNVLQSETLVDLDLGNEQIVSILPAVLIDSNLKRLGVCTLKTEIVKLLTRNKKLEELKWSVSEPDLIQQGIGVRTQALSDLYDKHPELVSFRAAWQGSLAIDLVQDAVRLIIPKEQEQAKRKRVLDSRMNWMSVGLALAFIQANKSSALVYSILPLAYECSQLVFPSCSSPFPFSSASSSTLVSTAIEKKQAPCRINLDRFLSTRFAESARGRQETKRKTC